MSTIDEEEFGKHMASAINDGFTLNPPGYERLSAWTQILTNLVHAKLNFERLSKDQMNLGDLECIVQQEAFFVAGIMAYCRCYASAGAGIPKLDPKKVYAGSEDGLDIHKKLMSYRNKFAAHSDHNDLTRLTLAVKEKDDQIIVRHMITIAMPLPEVPDFIEAVSQTEHFVSARLNQQLDKMGDKAGKIILLD
ncbi:hypothetical protein [Tropicibacter alexandrii]|uniref:hypothetical protein n=1 Tax=Tropicibacter alexandrii TaxID=2267683 RepID=UPI001008D426|nr:hypothetical protein [Tropicibacter alexandrii]